MGDYHGKGIFKVKNGNTYEGDFIKGVLTGSGKINYSDRAEYIGEIKDWTMHGEGVYQIKSNGESYSGSFVNDVLSGQGEVNYKTGDHYIGELVDWVGNGLGEMIKKSGEHYIGEFKNGIYHGKGKLVYKNKSSFEGRFENGIRHGIGVYTRAKPKGHKKQVEGLWQHDQYVSEKELNIAKTGETKKSKAIDAEKLFYGQMELLNRKLNILKPTTKRVPNLYMLNFAGYGSQDVFMKEAHFAKELFDSRLGTQGRSISLINNHKVNDKTPLASITNLEYSLNHLASIMDVDEDILFLFLTSHGSKDHELSVSLSGVPLNDLSANNLSGMLKDTGIKWKVIVVSSCYSGGFIKALKDEHTMILTASKSDHVSFGCDDYADSTFFGKAFFKKSLPYSETFKLAFKHARDFISLWEDEKKYDHSDPQIWTTQKIEQHLALWRKSLVSDLEYSQQQLVSERRFR